MNEHSETFAARLAKLLAKLLAHPFYGAPCPPQPDFSDEDRDREEEREAAFDQAVDWLLVNRAFREGARRGEGNIISLVDGTITTRVNLRERMAPWALVDIGPNRGIKQRSPVDKWLRSAFRISVHHEELRSDRSWPLFAENDYAVYNHYRPAAATGGDDDECEAAKPERRFLPSPMAPLAVAETFFADTYTLRDGNKSLYYWRGSWWRWERTRWREVEDCEMRAEIYRYTRDAIYLDEEHQARDWAPNDRRVSAVLDALTSVCLLANTIEQPCWLDGRTTGVLIPCANGIYDLDSNVLMPHSPLLFNIAAVPFAYDPKAGEPVEWNRFTKSAWPDSPESIARLEEWMGYVVGGQTHLHKIFYIVGPPRGGRGTIGRILAKLLGPGSTCGPTLKSISGDFGLMPFIGRALAVIGDARFAGDRIAVTVERLLSISGEDTLDVNRKNNSFWSGKLPTRVMILSNELLKLTVRRRQSSRAWCR
jgi:D5 N terminal like/Family of unknown function (DUF5906)